MTIFQCENSTDGIFTAVYDAWASRLGHANVRLKIRNEDTYELFADYIEVETDSEKAEKVARTFRRRLSMRDYEFIYFATLSKDEDKADHIYRTIVCALAARNGCSVMGELQHPSICRVFEMHRNVWHEAHRYMGFVRFTELANGILASVIEPENAVLPAIGEHFADRFPLENFMIYDKRHRITMLHTAGKQWFLLQDEIPDEESLTDISERELHFQRLWNGFCHSIAIRERTNKALQQQLLPLKFRAHMTEIFD